MVMERETPSSLGFFMPAEWGEHESTWVIFPHNENTWPGGRLQVVQKVYAQMLASVSTGEKVNLLVENNSLKELASKLIFENDCAIKKNILFHTIPTMDSWIRDCGPTFLLSKNRKQLAMVEWVFNAWGEKYESEEPLSNDKVIPSKINELLKVRAFLPNGGFHPAQRKYEIAFCAPHRTPFPLFNDLVDTHKLVYYRERKSKSICHWRFKSN